MVMNFLPFEFKTPSMPSGLLVFINVSLSINMSFSASDLILSALLKLCTTLMLSFLPLILEVGSIRPGETTPIIS